jgi:LemA protein
MSTISLILAAIVVLLLLFVIAKYNRLVSLRNRFKNAFAQIDVQLKRRYDLIPNLVESAKGYLQHERQTLENVTNARNQAAAAGQKAALNPADASAIKGLMGAESVLSGALGRLFAVMEAYPDLKANQTIMALMEELTSTENKISFARQAYNDSVMTYNITCQSFPDLLIAAVFGFKEAALFEISKPEEKEAPKVSFSNRSQ